MKKNILYITLIFALCFGIKAQAQNIVSYETKLNSLSEIEANILEDLVIGSPTSMFVSSTENNPKIHYGNSDIVLDMSINKTSDAAKLASVFDNELKGVVVLSINWNGQDEITIPLDVLAKMEHLRYVCIYSYEQLSETVIQNRFHNLLVTLGAKKYIEVLYYTMKEPS